MIRRSIRAAAIFSPMPILSVILGLNWGLLYVVCFAILALAKVLYLSLTFNDCKTAAESLKKEIAEARVDLAKRGFNFVTQ